MMHSQEIVVEAKESIKKQIQNKFKSNMLPMHRSFVNKQVHEEKSNKHMKIEQVQLQKFQHIKRCFSNMKIFATIFSSLIIAFSSVMSKLNNITIT